jgi:hypothetical protein
MLIFPNSPTDGQIVTSDTKKWKWVAATSTWDLVPFPDVQAENALTSADAAAVSATLAATSAASINDRIYPGLYSTDPVTRPDGTTIQNGDVCSLTSGVMRVRISGAWQDWTTASATAAAASASAAASSAATINNHIYPGLFSVAPTTRPDSTAIVNGDIYFSTAGGMYVYTSGVWAQSVGSAALAATTGASLVGYDGGTVQDVLDGAKPMASYTALRAYTGRATSVRITDKTTGGTFVYDSTDTTTTDDGGTILVDASNRRWKRIYSSDINTKWFGADPTGTADCVAAFTAAYNAAKAGTGRMITEPGTYRINTGLDFSDVAGTGASVNWFATRAGYDRQSALGVELWYYGTGGFALTFGSSWSPTVVDGISVLSKAAGQNGVMILGARGQYRNFKITNCDQVALQLGGGTSNARQAFYSQIRDGYIDYPGGSSATVTAFSGPVGVKGVWVCGGFPASNANEFNNVIVYGGYDKRVVFDGSQNRWKGGDLTYISSVATSSIFEVNGNGNICEEFYIEPGTSGATPANFFVFGSTAAGNIIKDYYTVGQIPSDKIQDGGYNNEVKVRSLALNLASLARPVSYNNLLRNTRFHGTNGSPSVGQSPYGWVNFAATGFTQTSGTTRGDKYALTVTAPVSTGLSCIQYLYSQTAGRDRWGTYPQKFWRGQQVTGGVWAQTSVAGQASVRVTCSGTSGSFTSSTRIHSGSGNWEFLVATIKIPDDAGLSDVQFQVRSENNATGGVSTFSEPICVLGNELPQSIAPSLAANEAILNGRMVYAPIPVFTNGATTPDVSDTNVYQATNTSATTITNFTNGLRGQPLLLQATNGNTTIANGTNIKTTTGANKTLTANAVYKFITFDGTVWYEY